VSVYTNKTNPKGHGYVRHHAATIRFERLLALTKVNWNTTQFDQKLPAPIKAAREVGRILKHIEFGADVSSDFRKYT
jgi:hypothetical protein